MKAGILLVAGAFLIIFSISLGWILLQPGAFSPASDGSLNQSPFFYLLLFIGILAMGFVFSKLYNDNSSDKKFFFGRFVNVAVAAVLFGGLIHELVHVILLQHPTQFRVHFGDVKSVFSTCCLAPGELPFEELAYVIQFAASVLWIFAFRHVFFSGADSEKSKQASNTDTHSKKMNKKNKEDSTKKSHSAEEDVDEEWEAQRRVLEHYLNPKKEHPHHVRSKNQLDSELSALNSLKFNRKE